MTASPAQVISNYAIRAACHVIAVRRLVVRAEGLEHLPARGPLLIAAHHEHHLYDALALLEVVPRRLHFLVTLDWVQSPRTRLLMEWATRIARWPALLRAEALTAGADGLMPQACSVYRLADVPAYQRRALHDSVGLLRDGESLVVFPEGFPAVDPRFTPKTAPGQFLPFQPGFASMAALAQRYATTDVRIPIVPSGISYRPAPRWLATLRFGTPLYLEPGQPRAEFVRTVQELVAALSAPDAGMGHSSAART